MIVVLAGGGWAASAADGPVVVHSVRNDTSPPLREMVKNMGPVVPSAINREIMNRTSRHSVTRNMTDQVDPVLQSDARPDPLSAPTPPVNLVFDGSNDQDNSQLLGFAVVPPDTEGDVGPNHYVQWVNLVFEIFDKAGNSVLGPSPGNAFWAGFGGVCETENSGDPLVMYDHLADRWVVSQFGLGSVDRQCVAVSTTPDPTGSYHRYEFSIENGSFPDYPKMGVWEDGYYYTADIFSFSFLHARAAVFERDKMLVGQPAQEVEFSFNCTNADCPFGVIPADLEGPAPPAGTPNTFVAQWDQQVDGSGFVDGVRLWDFSVDWKTPNNSTFTDLGVIPGAPLDRELCGFSRNCAPACNGGEGLDVLSDKQMWRAQVRHSADHDTMVVNTTADAGSNRAGIRWAELRNSGSGWSIFQEGTYAPNDGIWRWMGSIAMDGAGNICVGYTASSSSVCPSIRYACRSAGDPLGTLPGGEKVMKAGTGAQVGSSNRWGDYSSLTVDAADDCGFWFTSEYYQSNGSFDFKTSIGNWDFPECSGGSSFQIVSVLPGMANMTNTWSVAGATALGDVVVQCRPVGGNAVNLGTTTADSNGDATLDKFVPGAAGGRTIQCAAQDVSSGGVTPVFEVMFP